MSLLPDEAKSMHPKMMSSAFALAKDDDDFDEYDDKIKEHMKLVPVRYTKISAAERR